MSTVHAEHSQTLRKQNAAVQHLNASREEIILLSHLIEASLVVESRNPLRKAIAEHWDLSRAVLITFALLLSATLGWLIPQIADGIGIF
jgi:hypothetical protein